MGLSCGAKCIKYLFFIFNFIFFVLGIAVLGVGIYSRVQNDSLSDIFTDGTFVTAANLLIAGGTIVAIIGFIGCCGALKEVKALLILYAVIVILIFVLEIAGGAYAYARRGKVEEALQKELGNALDEYGGTSLAAKGLSKAIDLMQEKLDCCGSSGPSDWSSKPYITKANAGNNDTNTHIAVPKSCCKDDSATCNRQVGGKFNTGGCFAAGKTYVKDNLWLIGGVGVGIAVVQLLGIGFAIGLVCSIGKDSGKGGSGANA